MVEPSLLVHNKDFSTTRFACDDGVDRAETGAACSGRFNCW